MYTFSSAWCVCFFSLAVNISSCIYVWFKNTALGSKLIHVYRVVVLNQSNV